MSTTKQKTINVNVTAFRDNLKDYLEVAEKELLIINGKNGKRYVVTPLNDVQVNLNKILEPVKKILDANSKQSYNYGSANEDNKITIVPYDPSKLVSKDNSNINKNDINNG